MIRNGYHVIDLVGIDDDTLTLEVRCHCGEIVMYPSDISLRELLNVLCEPSLKGKSHE